MKYIIALVGILMLSGCLRDSSSGTTTTTMDWSRIVVGKVSTTTTIATTTTVTTSTTLYMPKNLGAVGESMWKCLDNCTTTSKYEYNLCANACGKATMNLTSDIYNVTATTSTTSTSTTTTTTTLADNVPAKIVYPIEWSVCEFNRDCNLVNDCCGIDYGWKYAINTKYENDWTKLMKNYCMSPTHRKSCGWASNQSLNFVCENSTCVIK